MLQRLWKSPDPPRIWRNCLYGFRHEADKNVTQIFKSFRIMFLIQNQTKIVQICSGCFFCFTNLYPNLAPTHLYTKQWQKHVPKAVHHGHVFETWTETCPWAQVHQCIYERENTFLQMHICACLVDRNGVRHHINNLSMEHNFRSGRSDIAACICVCSYVCNVCVYGSMCACIFVCLHVRM